MRAAVAWTLVLVISTAAIEQQRKVPARNPVTHKPLIPPDLPPRFLDREMRCEGMEPGYCGK